MAISVYQLKPAFIALLRPAASFLCRRGFTANQVTVLASALSILYGAVLCLRPLSPVLWYGLPLWLFVRMALNAVDGIMAREFDQKSRLGGLLNEGGDVVADAALFVPLAFIPGVWGALVALFIWLALATEFAGVLGLLIGAGRRYDGPMGKSDRALVVGLAALGLGWALGRGADPALYLNLGLGLASILMLVTVYNRLRRALLTRPDAAPESGV